MCNNYLLLQVFLTTLIENVCIYLSNIYTKLIQNHPKPGIWREGPRVQSWTGAIFGQYYIGNINNLKTYKRCLFFCQLQYQYKLHTLFVLFFFFKNKSYILKGVLKMLSNNYPTILGH